MDAAAAFLHRHERKAIERRRKREPLLALAPSYLDGKLGLLAITPARVMFARRRWLATPIDEWSRRDFKGARLETKRYGIVHLSMAGRPPLVFELTDSGHKHAITEALFGPQKRIDPVKALTQRPQQRSPRRPTAPVADPLGHRGTPAHEAKLRDLVARGMMTQKEMDWQLGR